jgi:cell surface protein SprA
VSREQGVRAPNIYVADNFSQKNNLTASTSRALWPGASLSLNWGVDWGINKNYYILTDANGVYDSLANVLTTGNLNRTYLSLPNFLFFSVFENDIEGVVNEYARRKDELPIPELGGGTAADTLAYNQALVAYNRRITTILSETFEEQLEAFNWLPKGISSYLPRMNWNFTWNGLEKLPFLSGWAQSASIRHAYTGRFVRNFRESDQGRVPETQTVSRGFSPLVQLTVTGKPDVFNGTATGSISYNTTTDFALVTAARSEISKELKSDLQTEVRYQRRGLKLPIFGMNLRNDVEFSFQFTYGRTQRKRFNLTEFKPEGTNDGSTRIMLRPNIRYSLSNTVTASAFLSYEATIPDDEGSRDIRRSTTKVGIDLRVGISGGR